MSKVVNITAARARLTRLVQEAFLERKRILIGKHGVPMAALLPIAEYEELLQDLEDLRAMQQAEASRPCSEIPAEDCPRPGRPLPLCG